MPLEQNAQRSIGPKGGRAVNELQGLNIAIIAGAAAGTDMPIPGARKGDVVKSVIDLTNAADDTPNITVQDTHAQATISFAGSVGTPVDAETVSVSDGVTPLTITFESTVTSADQPVSRVDANNVNVFSGLAVGDLVKAVRDVINAHFGAPGSSIGIINASLTDQGGGDWDVDLRAESPGTGGNAYTLAQAATNVTVSGANFTGGRNDLAFTSATGLGTSTLQVFWYDVSDNDLANV